MEACYGGHYDIVVFLLMKGADIHAKSPKVNNVNVCFIRSISLCSLFATELDYPNNCSFSKSLADS